MLSVIKLHLWLLVFDLSRSFLILSIPRAFLSSPCPPGLSDHFTPLCLHSDVFPLLFCVSLSCSLPYLDFAWLISFSTWQTHIHMHTNSTKCVSLLLSSHSFIPISMSPLPLTHFYYSHRSLPLTLWPPLCLSFCLGVYEQSYIESVWLAQTHRRGGQRVRWGDWREFTGTQNGQTRLVRILETPENRFREEITSQL